MEAAVAEAVRWLNLAIELRVGAVTGTFVAVGKCRQAVGTCTDEQFTIPVRVFGVASTRWEMMGVIRGTVSLRLAVVSSTLQPIVRGRLHHGYHR